MMLDRTVVRFHQHEARAKGDEKKQVVGRS